MVNVCVEVNKLRLVYELRMLLAVSYFIIYDFIGKQKKITKGVSNITVLFSPLELSLKRGKAECNSVK